MAHPWTSHELANLIKHEENYSYSGDAVQCRLITAWNVPKEVFDGILPLLDTKESFEGSIEDMRTILRKRHETKRTCIIYNPDSAVDFEKLFIEERDIRKRGKGYLATVWILFENKTKPKWVIPHAWEEHHTPYVSSQPC